MRKLLLLACFFTAVARPQSDCGNCWVIDGGCDPTAICDITGLCQVCAYFVDCDNHDCAQGLKWRCVCPWGESAECKPSKTFVPSATPSNVLASVLGKVISIHVPGYSDTWKVTLRLPGYPTRSVRTRKPISFDRKVHINGDLWTVVKQEPLAN